MNNFRYLHRRNVGVTMLTTILMVFSVAFSIIGYAASDGTKQQLEAVESRYTTIGVMNDQNAQVFIHEGGLYDAQANTTSWVSNNFVKQEDGSILWDDGTVFYSANVLESVAKDSSQIRMVSRSSILSAHVEGIYGLTSGSQNPLQYNHAFDNYSYNMVVIVAQETAPDIESNVRHYQLEVQHTEGLRYFLFSPPSFDNGISARISAHPWYDNLLQRNRLRGFDYDAISIVTDPFEEEYVSGKKYIFRAFIKGIPVVQVREEVENTVSYVYKTYTAVRDKLGQHFQSRNLYSALCMEYTTKELFSLSDIVEQKGVGQKNFTLDINRMYKQLGEYLLPYNTYYYALPEDSLPFYAEFTGTLEEFLESEEGQVWRDVIIPMAEVNQQSATVMLVEDLDYLHAFNSGKAIIVEGRKIDPSEFVRGDKVCVVSSAYADYAGLEIGDTLNLDFYDTGYFLTSAKIENWDTTGSEFVMTHNPLQESNRIGYEEEYTIVGIYSAPEYEYGTTSFYADTIFVPKASVPNAEEYEDPSLPLLNSVVLMNGTTEEFEAYMESQGFGGYYTYFDQDYSSTIAGLQALSQNALRLVILAAAVFFVTAILFYYLNFKRMIPVAYGMRRMGQHPFKLWWQMEMVTLPIILIAVFGGAYLGVYFFEYVTMELFETNIIMDIETVKWLTLLEAAVLCTVSLLVAIPISLPRLMKRR